MPRITKAQIEGLSADALKSMLTRIILSDAQGYTKDEIEIIRRLIEKKLTGAEMVAQLTCELHLT
ncbi:MAG TPA: hypothetical protein VMS64_11570 [Candidatus Methylomirabilis sp.]|nr:hypothetical protein [Candidatus Methylomirabilis sp.]